MITKIRKLLHVNQDIHCMETQKQSRQMQTTEKSRQIGKYVVVCTIHCDVGLLYTRGTVTHASNSKFLVISIILKYTIYSGID